jgi:putative Ca2+/H+ antiporter (TMEM165/GDT1 family)
VAAFSFGAFLLVFGVILGLELVDRTNFATMALAARQPARPTWVGATLGFVAVSAIACTIGAVFISVLGPHNIDYLRIGGGIFLIAYALFVYFEGEKEEAAVERVRRAPWLVAFVAIFLLELGDTTMIFEVVFVGATGNPLLVFVAGSLALSAAAAEACAIGSRLGAKLEPKVLQKIVVVVLVIVGIITVLYGLEPQWFPSIGTFLVP